MMVRRKTFGKELILNFFIGKIHEVQMIVIGEKLSLIIDQNSTRFIDNPDGHNYLNMSEIDGLYIGGLPNRMKARALQLWHIREAISFRGIV